MLTELCNAAEIKFYHHEIDVSFRSCSRVRSWTFCLFFYLQFTLISLEFHQKVRNVFKICGDIDGRCAVRLKLIFFIYTSRVSMARWWKKKKDFNAEKIYKFFWTFFSSLADVKTVFSPSSSFTNNWNIIVDFVVCFFWIFSHSSIGSTWCIVCA